MRDSPAMRTSRFLAGVLAAVLSVTLLGFSPARAVAPAGGPLATTVTGACSGGPGRVSLTVYPPAENGSFRVEATARGLIDGSRWRVQVAGISGERGFRRVAVDGEWTVATRFPAAADPDDEPFFFVSARERGDRTRGCLVLNQPASPAVGYTQCSSPRRVIVLFARELDNGRTVVRSFVDSRRPDISWHLTLTAIGAASRHVVEFDDVASRRGLVSSRVVLTGVKDPRLQLVATTKNGGRCFIGLNPPNVTTAATLNLHDLLELGASRR